MRGMMMGNLVRLLQLCLLGSFCQTRRHSEFLGGIKTEKRICPTKFPDVGDTLGYDFISQYSLDQTDSSSEIRRIKGSYPHQTAYRIGRNSDLRVPTRAVFSHGLPTQFSFTTTLRMTERTLLKDWDIFRIEDAAEKLQFGISINGRKKFIRLKYISNRLKMRSVDFSLDNQYFIKFFNSEWHKLSLSISHHLVQLYIDCDKVGSSVIPSLASINSTGQITSGKRIGGDPVTFDLQWLMLYCDPKTAERDQCRELQNNDESTVVGGVPLSQQDDANDKGSEDDLVELELPNGYDDSRDYRKYSALTLVKRTLRDRTADSEDSHPVASQILAEALPPTILPPVTRKKSAKDRALQFQKSGPMGPPGPPGNPGLPGLPGLPCMCQQGTPPLLPLDIQGEPNWREILEYLSSSVGPPGLPGLPGRSGSVGQQGPRGPPGEAGTSGAQGSPGLPGSPGPPGLSGMSGLRGQPGMPGMPGSPGQSVSLSDIRDICVHLLQERLEEMITHLQGAPGPPGVGRPGKPGPRGHSGIQGDPGQQGLPGDRGHPGHPGPQGPPGVPGPRGETGEKGAKGAPGIGEDGRPGPPGAPGPPGVPRHGRPGAAGPRGPPGMSGPPGIQGRQGVPGTPGQCNNCQIIEYLAGLRQDAESQL